MRGACGIGRLRHGTEAGRAAAEAAGGLHCSTAQGDIRLLQQEKANVVERIAEGATSIYPAGLVLGVLSGTETTKLQVAIGEYNEQIDARIAEIKQTCGLQ